MSVLLMLSWPASLAYVIILTLCDQCLHRPYHRLHLSLGVVKYTLSAPFLRAYCRVSFFTFNTILWRDGEMGDGEDGISGPGRSQSESSPSCRDGLIS